MSNKNSLIFSKHRGKRIDNNEWVDGNIITYADDSASIISSHSSAYKPKNSTVFCTNSIHDVIPETVGEYIRLIDENGKEISQRVATDDIISYYDPYMQKYCMGIVKLINGNAYVINNKLRFSLEDAMFRYEGRVVGNIFDNPKLYKERKETSKGMEEVLFDDKTAEQLKQCMNENNCDKCSLFRNDLKCKKELMKKALFIMDNQKNIISDMHTEASKLNFEAAFNHHENFNNIEYGVEKICTLGSKHLDKDVIDEINAYIADKNDVCDEILSRLSFSKTDEDTIWIVVPGEGIISTIGKFDNKLSTFLFIARNLGCSWLRIDIENE